MILQNKKDWEVVNERGHYIKNKKDGRQINERGFDISKDYGYTIMGELGYREGLLKLIIIAESLVKKKQFNSSILTKLLNEKKHNTSLHQLLNKEGRIDEVIQQLESIQQSQKKGNKSVKHNKPNNKLPAGVIWGGM